MELTLNCRGLYGDAASTAIIVHPKAREVIKEEENKELFLNYVLEQLVL